MVFLPTCGDPELYLEHYGSLIWSAALLVRASCVRTSSLASSGKNHADCQPFYGFRLHLLLGWPGLTSSLMYSWLWRALADGEMALVLLERTRGLVLVGEESCLHHRYASSTSICSISLACSKPGHHGLVPSKCSMYCCPHASIKRIICFKLAPTSVNEYSTFGGISL